MTTARSPHLGRRDLLVAIVAFWAIASLAFTAGRWFMPSFEMPSLVAALTARGASAEELRQAAVFDLRSVMGSPPHPKAALDATGALAGRYTFEYVDGFSLQEVGPDRFDVSLRVRGSVGVLLVAGTALPVGGAQSAGLTIAISAPGLTFNSAPGQCSLEITRIEPFTPRLAGWVSCADIAELRSGATVAFTAAFDAIPPEF